MTALRQVPIPGTPVHRWRAFAVLAVSCFMTIVDLTIVNVALPTIGRKLHFSESNLQWIVTAYALTFGGFLLLGGRAADLLGRRRILMLGLSVFTAASLACALATTDSFLIAMRGIQGLGAAIVLPAALSIVMNMFAEGAERNKALGIWGAIGAAGATADDLAVRRGRRAPGPRRSRVHGHFWGDLAGPLLLVGAGTAFAFIPVSIAALAGVADREAGLASGLLNTSQQVGGAIGVAVASTVAATRFTSLSHAGTPTPAALTGGFQWALWVCGAIGVAAVPVTFLLIRRDEVDHAAQAETAEPSDRPAVLVPAD